MELIINRYVIGAIENNTYLIQDNRSNVAVLIDPAAPSRNIQNDIQENNLNLSQIWITHAHFDHIGGVRWFLGQSKVKPSVMIHPLALPLWNNAGGSKDFGFDFDPGKAPDHLVHDGDTLAIGDLSFIVLHTPGHTPGHVTFYCAQEKVAFCGDLIFFHGVGRTDLKGSEPQALIKNITDKIFSLPDDTILYPGHGQPTTVKEEKLHNPFI